MTKSWVPAKSIVLKKLYKISIISIPKSQQSLRFLELNYFLPSHHSKKKLPFNLLSLNASLHRPPSHWAYLRHYSSRIPFVIALYMRLFEFNYFLPSHHSKKKLPNERFKKNANFYWASSPCKNTEHGII